MLFHIDPKSLKRSFCVCVYPFGHRVSENVFIEAYVMAMHLLRTQCRLQSEEQRM